MTASRRAVLLAALGAALAVVPAQAAERLAFEAARFEAAQRAGRSILVDVTAPWCPICFVQGLTLAALGFDSRFKDLIVFTVDYDSQKAVLRRFNVQRQGTLIVFKGTQEVARSVGDPTAAHIDALLAESL